MDFLLIHKNMSIHGGVPRRRRTSMRGHVTGSFAGGSRDRYQGGGIHNSLSQSIDLAKLNPNCHMNYSIIFTEISFYPETSNLINCIESKQLYSIIQILLWKE